MVHKGWFRFDGRCVGIVDGSNMVFETTEKYGNGTLNVILNGQVKDAGMDDGCVELGGKRFKMKKPPVSGDIIGACYVVGE